MHIAQVLQAAQQNYSARFAPFDQSQLNCPDNKEGVCFALCKIWLNTPDKIAKIHLAQQFFSENAARANQKQTKYVQKIRSASGDQVKYKHLKLIATGSKAHGANFWSETTGQIDVKFDASKYLLSLSFEGQPGIGHAVAACNHNGVAYFFDPNGGILAFGDVDDFSNWLEVEFPTASQSHYDKIFQLKVYMYDKTADYKKEGT